MPKLIGHHRAEFDATLDVRSTDVDLTYPQARILHRHGVAIRAALNTSDRGGPGRLAKRWYRWYADAAAILACPGSTPAMRRRVGRAS